MKEPLTFTHGLIAASAIWFVLLTIVYARFYRRASAAVRRIHVRVKRVEKNQHVLRGILPDKAFEINPDTLFISKDGRKTIDTVVE